MPEIMPETILLGDAHTHLDQYAPEEIPGIVRRAEEAHVGFIVCAGTTLESTRACIQMSRQYEIFYAGVGIHPMEARQPVDQDTYRQLEALARENPRVVCISEVGLDYLPDSPDHAIQDQVFRQHIRLARSLDLPVIFHSRESHGEVFRLLREEQAGDVGGAMHYFQGDEATAREAIDCGFFISLARPLLRLPELQEVARTIPLGHIVLETDAFPQPFKKNRHSWTEPRHVLEVAQKLADLKGVSLSEVAEITSKNLASMLKLEHLLQQ
ncbi:MAG TPA: TatD family hydrolase [Dehalococcoidia bacterium]|nr:TatD family hydrolase [Dehalococcoidia bacterium]